MSVGGPTRHDVEGRHPMFAAPARPALPVRRGPGLAAAAVLHVLLIVPWLVSVISYGEEPAQSAEPLSVTIVMTPLRAAGNPSLPKPELQQPQSAAARPVVVQVPSVAALSTSDVLDALDPTPVSDAPPAPISSDVPRDSALPESDVVLQSAGPPGEAPLRPSASSSPLAIGAESGQSNWAGLVLGRLEQFRRYPAAARRLRQEGVCYVRFTIDREGRVLSSALERSSGHALLDREAVALVRRAEPLPAPPPELQGVAVTLTVPVEFFLKR